MPCGRAQVGLSAVSVRPYRNSSAAGRGQARGPHNQRTGPGAFRTPSRSFPFLPITSTSFHILPVLKRCISLHGKNDDHGTPAPYLLRLHLPTIFTANPTAANLPRSTTRPGPFAFKAPLENLHCFLPNFPLAHLTSPPAM